MSLNTQNFIPGNRGTQDRTLGQKRDGLPNNNVTEISDTLSPAPGTDGKRDHVDDVSDPDSPMYDESSPDFDPDWKEENALGFGGSVASKPATPDYDLEHKDNVSPINDTASKGRRDDSTGTGGIAGVPLTGNGGIQPARAVADSILSGWWKR